MTDAEFVVELRSGGGGGRERFGAEATLFAEESEVLEVDGFHEGRTAMGWWRRRERWRKRGRVFRDQEAAW